MAKRNIDIHTALQHKTKVYVHSPSSGCRRQRAIIIGQSKVYVIESNSYKVGEHYQSVISRRTIVMCRQAIIMLETNSYVLVSNCYIQSN